MASKNYNGCPYTKGRNIYGKKAHTEFVVLKKETALKQLAEIYWAVSHTNNNIEYTIDSSCFAHGEIVMDIMVKYILMALDDKRLSSTKISFLKFIDWSVSSGAIDKYLPIQCRL